MDKQTLDSLADMVCGDGQEYPTQRTHIELTRFFQRVGFSNFIQDGLSRKRRVVNALEQLTENNMRAVISRLADPKEYRGNPEQTKKAVTKLNEILMIEGLKVEIVGVIPSLIKITPQFSDVKKEEEFKPLPPPDFLQLKLEPGVGGILLERWNEVQKCLDANACLAATILMGSLLEGILLAVIQKFPMEANTSKAAPKNYETGKVKHFAEWSLSEMINVSHDLKWLDFDVAKFSHSLREFRNLIHPYQQMMLKVFPDKDTCGIGWLVVQAATNDLAKNLK